MSALPLLYLAWSLWLPFDEKIEGGYASFLTTDTAWVQVWGEQKDVVADIAKTYGFETVAASKNILYVKYDPKSPDLRFNLLRLAGDAGVDRIKAAHHSKPLP